MTDPARENPRFTTNRVLLVGAGHVELALALVGQDTPVSLIHSLAVVTNARGLPGLVERLEIEDINSPSEHTTDSLLVVLLRVLGAGLGSCIVGSTIYGQNQYEFKKKKFLSVFQLKCVISPVGQPVSPVSTRMFFALSPAIFSMCEIVWDMSSKYVA